jgi:hypothetical protein
LRAEGRFVHILTVQAQFPEDAMWKQFWKVGIGVIVAVVAASAQGNSPRGDVVLIGCLEGAQSGFALRDIRSGTRYRLDGTADMLGWHVGHELEVRGTLQAGSGQMATLKVDSVVYISPTCSPGSGGKS